MTAAERFLPALARRAVGEYLAHGRYLPQPDEREIPRRFRRAGASFVCIKRGDALRGCIGTYLPCYSDTCEEVIHNAVAAATGDPRFEPVTPEELPDVRFTVDVLSDLEPIPDFRANDPAEHGIVILSGRHHGLLLPGIEGVHTAEKQFAIAMQKAGLTLDRLPADLKLFRFTVERYTE